MDDLTRVPVRLAFRNEGEFVNAYIAPPNSMKDALLVGSMRHTYMDRHKPAWEEWKKLMGDILQEIVRQRVGVVPEMREEKAPQHERSGKA